MRLLVKHSDETYIVMIRLAENQRMVLVDILTQCVYAQSMHLLPMPEVAQQLCWILVPHTGNS
jgi:hypothetical protein